MLMLVWPPTPTILGSAQCVGISVLPRFLGRFQKSRAPQIVNPILQLGHLFCYLLKRHQKMKIKNNFPYTTLIRKNMVSSFFGVLKQLVVLGTSEVIYFLDPPRGLGVGIRVLQGFAAT